MSSVSTEASLSDPYIERLRQKYLVKNKSTSSFDDQSTGNGTQDTGTLIIPPNPSLTESECRHYNRAMKELQKGLEMGKKSLMNSISEYDAVMKTTSDGRDNKSDSTSEAVSDDIGTKQPTMETGSDTLTRSTTLPTLHSSSGVVHTGAQSEKFRRMSSTFPASEDMPIYSQEFRERLRTDAHPTMNRPIASADVKAIYSELMSIHQKLQSEKAKIAERQVLEEQLELNFDERNAELVMREADLLEKERHLLEREHSLSLAEQNMKKKQEIAARLEGVELEVQERMDLMQQQHVLELERGNVALQEKCREFKRLKCSFDTIKTQNENLRKRLNSLTTESKKVEVQNGKLKKRLENLHQRQDFKSMKQDIVTAQISKLGKENVELQSSTKSSKQTDKSEKQWGSMLEALSVLLDWISEVHLKNPDLLSSQAISVSGSGDTILSKEYLTDKCLKILPLLVDIIRALLSQFLQPKQLLPYLSFAYWSLCHLDETQHTVLSSTARRLGEELYKPGVSHGGTQKTSSAALILSSGIGSLQNTSQDTLLNDSKTYRNSYIHSNCPKIRMLSCIIILKSLHQVDTLAQVFCKLKKDLKEEMNRQLFIEFKATSVVLPYMTYKANKALMGHAVDVLLQMTMESPLLPSFLEQCSTEPWFRAFSSALRPPSSQGKSVPPNITTLEKLSILLQKLSKMKSNRRYFDAFSMGRNLQEWYRTCDPQNTFLSLNLRSILFNLNLKNSPPTSTDNTVL